jgi:hypothetical protein
MSLPIGTEQYLRRMLNDFGIAEGQLGLTYIQDPFTGDGHTVAFTLTHSPNAIGTPAIYLAGVLQSNDGLQANSYTLVGTTLTFSTAPGNSVAILAVYSY